MLIHQTNFGIKLNLKQRIDDRSATDGFLYKGIAKPGTPENAPNWIIMKITNNGDIDFADGKAEFYFKRTDRDLYSYN